MDGSWPFGDQDPGRTRWLPRPRRVGTKAPEVLAELRGIAVSSRPRDEFQAVTIHAPRWKAMFRRTTRPGPQRRFRKEASQAPAPGEDRKVGKPTGLWTLEDTSAGRVWLASGISLELPRRAASAPRRKQARHSRMGAIPLVGANSGPEVDLFLAETARFRPVTRKERPN